MWAGKELTDYAGRTYMHIPTDVDVKLNPSDGTPAPNSYIPEKCIHTWVSGTFVALLSIGAGTERSTDRPQQRCLRRPIVPQERPLTSQREYGYESQSRRSTMKKVI